MISQSLTKVIWIILAGMLCNYNQVADVPTSVGGVIKRPCHALLRFKFHGSYQPNDARCKLNLMEESLQYRHQLSHF